jgi:hypothetical protein
MDDEAFEGWVRRTLPSSDQPLSDAMRAGDAAYKRVRKHAKQFKADWLPLIDAVAETTVAAVKFLNDHEPESNYYSRDSYLEVDDEDDQRPDYTSHEFQTVWKQIAKDRPWFEWITARENRNLLEAVRHIADNPELFSQWYDGDDLTEYDREHWTHPITLSRKFKAYAAKKAEEQAADLGAGGGADAGGGDQDHDKAKAKAKAKKKTPKKADEDAAGADAGESSGGTATTERDPHPGAGDHDAAADAGADDRPLQEKYDELVAELAKYKDFHAQVFERERERKEFFQVCLDACKEHDELKAKHDELLKENELLNDTIKEHQQLGIELFDLQQENKGRDRRLSELEALANVVGYWLRNTTDKINVPANVRKELNRAAGLPLNTKLQPKPEEGAKNHGQD